MQEQINLTINCRDNVNSGGQNPLFYTGRHMGIRSQYGPLVVHADNGSGGIYNGIHRGDAGYCGGALRMFGDFHASCYSIRASAGLEKWIVANGIGSSTVNAQGNRISGLNVWRWDGSVFRYKGYIDTIPGGFGRIDENDPVDKLSLIGDYAYARNGAHNQWFVFNLSDMTWQAGDPPNYSEIQEGIDGHKYTFETLQYPSQTLPGKYRFTKEGASAMLNFYPTENDLRQQVAAMIYNYDKWKASHPGQTLPNPSPSDQCFADVPPSHQFYAPITALGMTGIVVGKP